MNVFSVLEGAKPVILAQPHGGTYVPQELLTRFNDRGKELVDTDWHINKLYAALLGDTTVVQSHIHRYVIDANRDPHDVSLYPGQNTTGLCPLSDFDGNPIYRQGKEPSNDEIEYRRSMYHAPYHAALSEQIERLKRNTRRLLFLTAILFDQQFPSCLQARYRTSTSAPMMAAPAARKFKAVLRKYVLMQKVILIL